ncbi:hypothetical protein E2C01_036559 [Portunus trituberculatus]|uniref:Uncharacterized protein n=1 Tax=Portunus trituberculatus TaxID=210409 RepID=A0A5B7FBQ0_PORTR|nr:hypothetical protein [Portunus trituberculatus]
MLFNAYRAVVLAATHACLAQGAPEKAFASSSFYRPDHPTIDDQVELAQRISFSLVDENNKMSRGQSMYMKRKKRSMRWIHAGEVLRPATPAPLPLSLHLTIPHSPSLHLPLSADRNTLTPPLPLHDPPPTRFIRVFSA